ncbi:MAG: hypothetical protein EYC70_05795 [Planctomycetota bacterium]|nr:MAG: hypothetical protein EYC70_05795 [Planctomycetota bacterium]
MTTPVPLRPLFPLLLLAACSHAVKDQPYLGDNPDLMGANITAEIRNGAFYMGPGDKVAVEIWNHQDLTQNYVVGPDGMLDCYLIGPVRAEGLTVFQLDELLTSAYARYLVDPSLVIKVGPSAERKVTVIGQVNSPSVLPMTTPRTTILEVIAQAGGVNGDGDETGVVVARNVEGRWQVTPYNITALFDPEELNARQEIPYVRPGDYVYVLRTWESEFFDKLLVVNQALRAVVQAERAILLGDTVSSVINDQRRP